MNVKKVLTRTAVFIGILAFSALSWAGVARADALYSELGDHLTIINAADLSAYRWNDTIARISVSQTSSPVDLRSLSAADVSAYRWSALGKFYGSQEFSNVDLRFLNAADVSAYRWSALAKFYGSQELSTVDFSKLNAADVSAYRWNDAVAKFSVSHGASTASFKTQGAAEAREFESRHYSPPGH
jgi:hypothetical protein